MAVLSAQSIKLRVQITPWVDEGSKFKGMSYGVSAASYDIRLGKLQPWKNSNPVPQSRWLAPGRFCLASSLERVALPNDITGMVHDKSTLARMGVALQNTFLDPGFRGWITLEIANHGPDAVQLCVGMPIAQIVFHELDEPTKLPYSGKYQDQPDEPVAAILTKGT